MLLPPDQPKALAPTGRQPMTTQVLRHKFARDVDQESGSQAEVMLASPGELVWYDGGQFGGL